MLKYESIMINYSRVILRIRYAQLRSHSLSAAQQLLSSCSITAEQFSEINYVKPRPPNYPHPILRINYAKPCSHSLSAAQQLPSSCSITAEQFSEINYVQLDES